MVHNTGLVIKLGTLPSPRFSTRDFGAPMCQWIDPMHSTMLLCWGSSYDGERGWSNFKIHTRQNLKKLAQFRLANGNTLDTIWIRLGLSENGGWDLSANCPWIKGQSWFPKAAHEHRAPHFQASYIISTIRNEIWNNHLGIAIWAEVQTFFTHTYWWSLSSFLIFFRIHGG